MLCRRSGSLATALAGVLSVCVLASAPAKAAPYDPFDANPGEDYYRQGGSEDLHGRSLTSAITFAVQCCVGAVVPGSREVHTDEVA
jgi:hypothetical protein